MAYVVKWADGAMVREDVYLVDARDPEHDPIWSEEQGEARRFETKAEARNHIARSFKTPRFSWLRKGQVRILRLVPRKAAP